MDFKLNKSWPWGLVILLSALTSTASLAQNAAVSSVDQFDKIYLNWYNLDGQKDNVQGASVNQAYEVFLKGRPAKKKVVVAVIDSGVDILHDDLKGRIWTNTKEIAGNGLDDDKNGYPDDLHGWGFLGNAAGIDIEYETLEFVRILRDLAPIYHQVKSLKSVPAPKQEEYKTYLKVKQKYEEEVKEYMDRRENYAAFGRTVQNIEAFLAKRLQKEQITKADLEAVSSTNDTVNQVKNWLLEKYKLGYSPESFKEMMERNEVYLNYHLNLEFNPRTILGDNLTDINDLAYGNSNVTGPRADHGTPVSGIIAGIRNNGLGIDGIAENVEIMALRAVPSGDEYDKDIALAIRYAVDNGANIINMSFGKGFSPQKHLVDEAAQYAEKNNVLLVHSAGNDGVNLDQEMHFPAKTLLKGNPVSTWIEVGASSMHLNELLVGDFSNYGFKTVDLFAPGVDVVSLSPGNQYAKVDGTSFSGPVVSGVAALVWSHYPELTAVELKDVLLKSVTTYPNLKVNVPNRASPKKKKVKFSTLSGSGGLVNAYQALVLADQIVKQKLSKN